jgi:hypothetical protein
MPLRRIQGVEVQLHAFLTSALDGGEWSASFPAHFTPPPPQGKNPLYPFDRRPSAPQSQSGRSGKEKKSHHCPCQELNHSHSAHSLDNVCMHVHITKQGFVHAMLKNYIQEVSGSNFSCVQSLNRGFHGFPGSA